MENDHGQVVIRFSDVTFGYDEERPLFEEASFSIREHAKMTLMGQNGAGKSSLFKLLTGAVKPTEGSVHVKPGASVAVSKQVMAEEHLEETIRVYFGHAFTKETPRDLDRRIKEALQAVNLAADLEKKVRDFSGGQQARLLLAFALIQQPDILLLDEPTNNLDQAGIEHLTGFLMLYPKTVLVISHDADFLNAFTEGVLYLDVFTHKIEQYVGNYFDVLEQISARLERERMQNARLLKDIQDRKDKINFFANKGGKMRKLASKLRDQVQAAEEDLVDVRREDKTIREFHIPAQAYTDPLVRLSSIHIMRNGQGQRKAVDITLRKGRKLFISGPNGIGKTTLLKTVTDGGDEGIVIGDGVRIGYYRQDFSGLDRRQTAYASLEEVMDMPDNETLRAVASAFLLTASLLKNTIGSLSEGQKGLLCFARFVLQKPGLLILDEPTNHINFRHLPVIAKALEAYQGGLIMVSHAPDFVNQIHFDERLDLSSLSH